MTPSVRVIAVTYSPGEFLDRLLDSLPDACSVPYEVVLADNGSTDGAPERAAQRDGVRLLRTGANVGYGAAANLGAADAQAPYLLICNPDLLLAPKCIDLLLDAADRHVVWGPGTDDLRARRWALSQCSGRCRRCAPASGTGCLRPCGRGTRGPRPIGVTVRTSESGKPGGCPDRACSCAVRPLRTSADSIGVLHVLRGRRPVRSPREARLVMHVGSDGLGHARGRHRYRPATATHAQGSSRQRVPVPGIPLPPAGDMAGASWACAAVSAHVAGPPARSPGPESWRQSSWSEGRATACVR